MGDAVTTGEAGATESSNTGTQQARTDTRMVDRYADEQTPWRDEERLRRLYVDERRTAVGIANLLDCTEKTVRTWLERHEIERGPPPWQDEDTLRRLREDGMSLAEIGDELDCSGETVRNWMDEYGIDTSRQLEPRQWHNEETLRSLYVERELTIQETADELGCHWLTVREWLESHDIDVRSKNPDPPDELTDEDNLRELYHVEGMSTYRIASELGCAPSTVHDYLKRHGIETRSVGSQSGTLHHRWEGGKEPYYGSNWHEQRRLALERDQNRCRRCGCSTEQHRAEYGIGLDVHHVQPLRTFDTPEAANDLDNLVTLCRGCHNRIEPPKGGDGR